MRPRGFIPGVIGGVALYAIGFLIGSTQSAETGTANTIAAITGTVGAAIAVMSAIAEIVRRVRVLRARARASAESDERS